MAHLQQQQFFDRVKESYPEHFKGISVVDFGSLDINGSLKDMFVDCHYTGVDIRPGKNVDVVCMAHRFVGEPVDTVVSGEMLEHDEHWLESLLNMYALLKDGGLMAISAAGEGRPEHGTNRTLDPLWGTSPSYYRNMTEEMFQIFKSQLSKPFRESSTEVRPDVFDIYFYGVK